MSWNDFNDADLQQAPDLIPKGTVAKVRLKIKPGGYDDESRGWTGGYATHGYKSPTVFLMCEFTLVSGPFARRKVWSNIGLHSPKGETWGNMGRSFIRAILNSARNLRPDDASDEAIAARRIESFAELDGIEFVARIDIDVDANHEPRNIIRQAVEPGSPEYSEFHSPDPSVAMPAPTATKQPSAGKGRAKTTPAKPALSGRPSWAA